MKKTLTTTDIANDLFGDKYAGWSWAGALALAEYLEEIEAGSGDEMELDIVQIRCDFAEYESMTAWAIDYFGGESYALEALSLESLEDSDDTIREYIQDRGSLIEFEGGIIVSSF